MSENQHRPSDRRVGEIAHWSTHVQPVQLFNIINDKSTVGKLPKLFLPIVVFAWAKAPQESDQIPF